MKLKKEGFFPEFGWGGQLAGSVRDLFCDSPQPDEDKIVEYLNAGQTCVFRPCGPGLAPDEHSIATATALLTDGVWLWPDVLGYYVKEEHLRILDAFVDHMRKSNWVVPTEDEIDLESLDLGMNYD